jgi:hypothetical protein
VSRERFGADVRELLERLLAAPGGSPHALPEPLIAPEGARVGRDQLV